MIAYIIRRSLYALPILLGVNILVFLLFFLVNTPEDMARLQLGGKRVTPMMIEQWKKQHSLHLPLFWNAGWSAVTEVPVSPLADETKPALEIPATAGEYRLIFRGSEDKRWAAERYFSLQCAGTGCELEPRKVAGTLAASSLADEVLFQVKTPGTGKLRLAYTAKTPSPFLPVVLEKKESIGFLERFTRTIFFQKSLRMLFFQFGKSDRGKDIGGEIYRRMWPSLYLSLPAFIFALVLTVFISMILAYLRGSPVDNWGIVLSVVSMSISGLFYIIGGQVLFGRILQLFPVSGYQYGWEAARFLLLPILISIIGGLGGGIRFYRTVFLEEMGRDYVRTARAKGLSDSSVLFKHILKNAMIPILTNFVVSLPLLFTGSLLLESFFGIPGMGSFLLDAIRQQDFAVVQAMVFLGSFLYIVGLIMTDISYTMVDPRVRLE